MSEQDKKLETHQVLAALRKKYDESMGKYTAIAEVADTTGGANRRCDLMVMGCWRSVGLHLQGFELKVSRSDWQKELQDVTKSDTFARHCHRWWLVFANKAAKLEEVPADWGVMECIPSGSIKVRRQAAKRKPEPLPWPMIASLLRAAAQQYKSGSFRDGELHKQFERGKASARSSDKWRADQAEKRAATAEHTLKQIREVFDDSDWWRDERMVRDLQAAMTFLKQANKDWLEQATGRLLRDREQIDKCLQQLSVPEDKP